MKPKKLIYKQAKEKWPNFVSPYARMIAWNECVEEYEQHRANRDKKKRVDEHYTETTEAMNRLHLVIAEQGKQIRDLQQSQANLRGTVNSNYDQNSTLHELTKSAIVRTDQLLMAQRAMIENCISDNDTVGFMEVHANRELKTIKKAR